MELRKGFRTMVAEAESRISTWSVDEARARLHDEGVVWVDLRDIRERVREGFVPGALHVPRGMLEFWIDPESPYHRDVFQRDVDFLFYCASGWRSALAGDTAREMGLARVHHLAGGFTAWCEAEQPVEKTPDGRAARG